MASDKPQRHVLARIKNWCGVNIEDQDGVPTILLRGKVIARFPQEDAVAISLCGSIRDQIADEPESLPAGVWPAYDNRVILIDLNQPGGVEEAFRALMNVYLSAENQELRDWWMSEDHLNEDPTCDRIAELIEEHRKGLVGS